MKERVYIQYIFTTPYQTYELPAATVTSWEDPAVVGDLAAAFSGNKLRILLAMSLLTTFGFGFVLRKGVE